MYTLFKYTYYCKTINFTLNVMITNFKYKNIRQIQIKNLYKNTKYTYVFIRSRYLPRTVSMNPWNFFDHFFDFRRGGELRGIRKSARIGCKSHNGGCDSAISNAVIPNDQRSDRLS